MSSAPGLSSELHGAWRWGQDCSEEPFMRVEHSSESILAFERKEKIEGVLLLFCGRVIFAQVLN